MQCQPGRVLPAIGAPAAAAMMLRILPLRPSAWCARHMLVQAAAAPAASPQHCRHDLPPGCSGYQPAYRVCLPRIDLLALCYAGFAGASRAGYRRGECAAHMSRARHVLKIKRRSSHVYRNRRRQKGVAELVARFLIARGVDRINGIQGGHIQPIWDWLGRLRVRIILHSSVGRA